MTMKTRAQLVTQANNLFDLEQPKVTKATNRSLVLDLLDSVPTKLDDVVRWMPPVIQLTRVPPMVLVNGSRYLIANSPTGAWAGQAWKLAEVVAGVWQFTDLVDRQVFPSLLHTNTVYAVEAGVVATRHFERTVRSRNMNTSFLSALTPQLVTGVEGGVVAGRSYDFAGRFMYISADVDMGIKFALDGPPADAVCYKVRMTMADGTEVVHSLSSWNVELASDGVPEVGEPFCVEVSGSVINPQYAWNIAAKAARTADLGSMTIPAGSHIAITDITDIG